MRSRFGWVGYACETEKDRIIVEMQHTDRRLMTLFLVLARIQRKALPALDQSYRFCVWVKKAKRLGWVPVGARNGMKCW